MPDERDPFTDPALKPPTDEFGRSDPEVLEREARRKEREARRTGEHAVPGAGSRSSGRRKERRPRKPKADRTKPARSLPSLPKVGMGRGRKKAEDAPATEVRNAPGAPEPAIPAPPAPPPTPPRRPTLRGRGGDGAGDGPTTGGRPPRSASYKRRRAFALGSLLVGILLVWFLVSFFQPFGDGKGTGRVSVTIPAGSDASKIADILDENGVVSNGTFFKWRLKLSGKSGDVQAGDYTLAHDMSYGEAIDRLTGKAAAGTKIVIPEGYSIDQIAEKLKATGIEGDYIAAAKSSPGFDPAAYGAPKDLSKLEGFLFPATYDLPEGATATDLVAEQLAAFKQNIAGVDLAYAKKKNLNVYDVLKIASMVERETSLPGERAKVAAVIYNRLKAGQPLGIDATTRYETNNYTGALTNAVLQSDTPYNTRTNQGLPPTPIGNPGLASIQAAANPAKVPFLYYVVNPDTCGHTFVKTAAEFNAAVARYNAARQAAGGNSPTNC
jgi:peptidoglycan lytic transglycosylase G